MGGRPRALDDVKRREVCALISAGCTFEAAARFIGCNAVTIRREAARNREFRNDLRKAELTAQALPLQAMRKAASSNWRAAAWLLERTQPQAFGLRRPWHCSAEDVEQATEIIYDVVQEEVTNRDDLRRIWERIDALCDHLKSLSKAAQPPRHDAHTRRERAKLLRQASLPSKPRPISSAGASESAAETDNDSLPTTFNDEQKSQ